MCQGHNKLVIVDIELWKKNQIRSDNEILIKPHMYAVIKLNSAVWDGLCVIYPHKEKVYKINKNKVNPTSQLESISSLILYTAIMAKIRDLSIETNILNILQVTSAFVIFWHVASTLIQRMINNLMMCITNPFSVDLSSDYQ